MSGGTSLTDSDDSGLGSKIEFIRIQGIGKVDPDYSRGRFEPAITGRQNFGTTLRSRDGGKVHHSDEFYYRDLSAVGGGGKHTAGILYGEGAMR